MKKRMILMVMCLCLSLLAACGAEKGGGDGSGNQEMPGTGAGGDENDINDTSVIGDAGVDETDGVVMNCRVVDEDNGSLLLARQDGNAGDIYRLEACGVTVTTESGEELSWEEIEEGSLLEVTFGGEIMESYPAQFGNVTKIQILESGFDDLCSLYLDVLEDLWEVDQALNNDIRLLGVDLSETSLSPAEQAAVAWHFGEEHGLQVVQGTYQELVEQGYIDGEQLYWEDGCLFSVTEKEMTEEFGLNIITFDAQKWRSGLGAYFFMDCESVQSENGKWGEYQIGAEAIS